MKLAQLALVSLLALALNPIYADDAFEITITTDKVQFAYDVKDFAVKPGQKVKLTLVNPADSVAKAPHNLLIVSPGKKDVVGMAANMGLADPAFMTTKQAIPDSADILFHTSLVQPGGTETLEFVAPAEAGDYPFMCTYPGHWMLMHGIMKVAP